eukprot:157824-Prymnesium_polylepis.1
MQLGANSNVMTEKADFFTQIVLEIVDEQQIGTDAVSPQKPLQKAWWQNAGNQQAEEMKKRIERMFKDMIDTAQKTQPPPTRLMSEMRMGLSVLRDLPLEDASRRKDLKEQAEELENKLREYEIANGGKKDAILAFVSPAAQAIGDKIVETVTRETRWTNPPPVLLPLCVPISANASRCFTGRQDFRALAG